MPFVHVLDRDQFDRFNDVDKITAPKIFIAGELDVLATPEDAQELFQHAREPKMLIVVEGIDHEYRHSPDDIMKVNALILKTLKAGHS